MLFKKNYNRSTTNIANEWYQLIEGDKKNRHNEI